MNPDNYRDWFFISILQIQYNHRALFLEFLILTLVIAAAVAVVAYAPAYVHAFP